MSTRSRIAVQLEDGSYTSIYCHCDGYPGGPGVGIKLIEHYNTFEKAKALMSGPTAHYRSLPPLHPDEVPYCTATKADPRGNSCMFEFERADDKPVDFKRLSDMPFEEYNYRFSKGKWRVYGGPVQRWEDLEKRLARIKPGQDEVPYR